MLGLVAIMGAYTAAIGYVAARWMPAAGCAALARRAAGALGADRMDARLVPERLSRGSRSATASSRRRCAGYAPVLGVYGVSLAVAVTAGALAALVLGRTQRAHRCGRARPVRCGAPALRSRASSGRSRAAQPLSRRARAGCGAAVDEVGRGPARAHDAAVLGPHAPASRRRRSSCGRSRRFRRSRSTSGRTCSRSCGAAKAQGSSLITGLLRRDALTGLVLQLDRRLVAEPTRSSGTTSAASCRSANSSRCRPRCASG